MENISMNSLLKSLQTQYQKGEFESVKNSLLENKTKFDKVEFHYNLGTVYSKMGNYAVGRYHLEKAISEGYESVAVKHNLKNVQAKLAVLDVSTSKSVEDVVLAKGLSYGPDFYIFLTLVLMVITSVLSRKKVFGKALITILFLISLVPVGTKFFYLDKKHVGVLFKDSQVFEGPSAIFKKSGKIPSGAKIVVGKEIEGWLFIERPVDYVGWIKSEQVGVIK